MVYGLSHQGTHLCQFSSIAIYRVVYDKKYFPLIAYPMILAIRDRSVVVRASEVNLVQLGQPEVRSCEVVLQCSLSSHHARQYKAYPSSS